MTHERDSSNIDLERALVRYLAERRMTRRQILERMAAFGTTAALAPIVAACTGGGGTSPSTAAATPTSAPSAEPSATPAPTPKPTPETELNVYNWDAYIGEDIQKQFEDKYKIKVTYDKFPDVDTQLAKIRSDGKGAGYDITYPTSTEIPGLLKDGVIQPLDLSLIPNAQNLGDAWKDPKYDPGNKNSMPYMWWTTGYAWNPGKIKDELSSWAALWDESYKGHINMLDDSREVFAVAAFRLGQDPNTTSDTDLDAQLELLRQQKPLVRTYNTDDIGLLTGGQAWITHAWSGDYYQMLADAPNTKYVVPTEGAVRGSDTMVVLSGAKHPVAANLWIDFMLEAKVSAENTNYIGYMGPNAAAQEFISPDILADPAVNPDKAVLDKLTELLDLGTDLDKYTQRWTSLKA